MSRIVIVDFTDDNGHISLDPPDGPVVIADVTQGDDPEGMVTATIHYRAVTA